MILIPTVLFLPVFYVALPLMDYWRNSGYQALDTMESHLSKQAFFANDKYSIADIALYAYTHIAEEGGYQMDKYPLIKQWCERVQAQPNYIEITN